VGILDARIERIEALRPELPHALGAIARGRTAPIQPHAVQLILGDQLLDEIELSFEKRLLTDAELPQVGTIPLLFTGRLGRLGPIGLQGVRERLLLFGRLLRLGPGLVDHQPFGMPVREFGIPGQHEVRQDLDLPLPQRRHLRSQKVKRQVGMHAPVRAGKVAIAVHILGEHGRTIDVCGQQPISEFVRVETLGQPRHVARTMVLDVNLAPRPGRPSGNAGIDPIFAGEAARLQGFTGPPGDDLAR